MNARIRKLYNQADKFAKENKTQNIAAPGNNYFELFHEKFAELIVRECAQVCLSQRDPANLNYKPSERFAEAVKQHFRVKE